MLHVKKTITGVWNNVAGVKDDLLKIGINIDEVITKEVGAGDSTLFWLDKWLASETLKLLYPEMYKLKKHKKKNVIIEYVNSLNWLLK